MQIRIDFPSSNVDHGEFHERHLSSRLLAGDVQVRLDVLAHRSQLLHHPAFCRSRLRAVLSQAKVDQRIRGRTTTTTTKTIHNLHSQSPHATLRFDLFA